MCQTDNYSYGLMIGALRALYINHYYPRKTGSARNDYFKFLLANRSISKKNFTTSFCRAQVQKWCNLNASSLELYHIYRKLPFLRQSIQYFSPAKLTVLFFHLKSTCFAENYVITLYETLTLLEIAFLIQKCSSLVKHYFHKYYFNTKANIIISKCWFWEDSSYYQ